MSQKYLIIIVLGIFLLVGGCIGPNNTEPNPNEVATVDQTNLATLSQNISQQNISGSTCPPESCTNTNWKIRAMQLEIPNYRKEISSTGKLILYSNQMQVVLPDDSSSAEEFGRIELYGLLRAHNNTERLLGRAPFLQPQIIKQEFVINLSSTGLCCGLEEEGFPLLWNVGSRQEYLQHINLESPSTQYYQNSNWNQIFNGNHELTHRFVRGLDLSSFLDEGLAMYAQDHGQEQPMTCQQGGYQQGGNFIPYTYLCRNDAGMVRFYNSGDCFWQRVEEKYGPDTVKRIITRIYNKEERDSMQIYYPYPNVPTVRWTSFSGQILIDLEQAFVPEVGNRFWEDFGDFGISHTMAEGQTYESEVIGANCQ